MTALDNTQRTHRNVERTYVEISEPSAEFHNRINSTRKRQARKYDEGNVLSTIIEPHNDA